VLSRLNTAFSEHILMEHCWKDRHQQISTDISYPPHKSINVFFNLQCSLKAKLFLNINCQKDVQQSLNTCLAWTRYWIVIILWWILWLIINQLKKPRIIFAALICAEVYRGRTSFHSFASSGLTRFLKFD